jgi:AraC-like DNA-binding protein
MNQAAPTVFSFWILLFSGFAFIGIFYSVKLLASKTTNKIDFVLGVYLLLQSVTLLEYVFYWTNFISSVPYFAEVSLLFPLLYGPLLLIYFDRSFGNDKPVKKYLVHFAPFIGFLILKIPFYLSPTELKLFHTHEIVFGRFFHYYYPWIKVCHLILYCVILYSVIHNQSGVGFMRAWARWIVGFFTAYVLLSLSYEVMVLFNVLTPQLDYFVSLANTATIFFIAWHGKGFTGVADGMSIIDSLKIATTNSNPVHRNEMIVEQSKVPTADRYKNSGLPKTLEIKLSKDLEALMQEHKLYKQNDLKLETLAARLNTTKHFISQVINEVHQVNFFEYINQKRVEEAKLLLRSKLKKDLNIIEIAYEVGFNNKGTFNSVFKKITGLTPTEFRKHATQLLESRSN